MFVDVPAITAADGGAGLTGKSMVHLGLWLPGKLKGVIIQAKLLMSSAKFTVIAKSTLTTVMEMYLLLSQPIGWDGLIENFVPHGYGVAQVSVFGTSEVICMDLMGLDEQAGIHAAVEWLGQQSWSNGNVGMIGKSYDGSTPWNAAAAGSSHLKTIVPMSGLIGVHELMWRNGSMEARGAIMHNGVYGSFGLDGDLEDVENAFEVIWKAIMPALALTCQVMIYLGQVVIIGKNVISSIRPKDTTVRCILFTECKIGMLIHIWLFQPQHAGAWF